MSKKMHEVTFVQINYTSADLLRRYDVIRQAEFNLFAKCSTTTTQRKRKLRPGNTESTFAVNKSSVF